jgi:hypothetical protein
MTDTNTDNADNGGHTIYVLVFSLLGTLISLPLVWFFTAAAYAPGIVA